MAEKPSFRVLWGHICEHAYLDEHHRLCLVGVMHGSAVNAVPAELFSLAVACRLEKVGDGEGPVQVGLRILTPNGKEELKLSADAHHVRLSGHYGFFTLRQLAFPVEGEYRFQMYFNNVLAWDEPYRIVVRPPQGVVH